MRYLLLIGGDGAPPDTAVTSSKEICGADDAVAWADEMTRCGVLVSGEVLRPPSDARTVRVRGGEVLIADGPFAETKEQIGGYYVVDCKDLDQAIEVASKIPGARNGSIEVRPIWEM